MVTIAQYHTIYFLISKAQHYNIQFTKLGCLCEKIPIKLFVLLF